MGRYEIDFLEEYTDEALLAELRRIAALVQSGQRLCDTIGNAGARLCNLGKGRTSIRQGCQIVLYLYSKGNHMLAIRLPEAIEERLDRLAKRTGRTKTYYAREAILQHLEDLEDIYLAEKRLAAIRSGRTKTIPLDEVMRRYGLED